MVLSRLYKYEYNAKNDKKKLVKISKMEVEDTSWHFVFLEHR